MPIKERTKVIIPNVRFSYVHDFEPTALDGQEPKVSVQLIIPKWDKTSVDEIKKAINNAIEDGKDKLKGVKNVKQPLRDGDEEKADDPNYAGCYFMNANARKKPGVVDKYKEEIDDPDDFYSGCYGFASVTFYAYNTAGNKGIGCGLNNVMKTKEGEHLGGGRATAKSDFDGYEFSPEEDLDDDF